MTKARTKDEMFMLRAFEEATRRGDIDCAMDRYLIGKLAGLQQRGVDAICTLLLQANFLKKRSTSDVSLTPHGLKLVEQLMSEEKQ